MRDGGGAVIKTRPTIWQLLVMVLFAASSFAALLFLWTSFGGPVPLKAKGYRFDVLIPEAAQLATNADVRISGVDVGRVVVLSPAGNRTRATIEVDPEFAPIPRRTRAILRSKTLLGETFVELAPGRDVAGPNLPEGGSLPASAVAPTVELDEILRALDPRTRRNLQRYVQAGAQGLRGRAADLSVALGELPGFVDEMDELAGTLDAQQAAVRRAMAGTGRVFDAISARDGDLRGLVTSGERTFGTLAARDDELADVFRRLPRFEREVSATLPPLTRLAERAAPTLERLAPAADELAPTLSSLRALSPDLRALMERVGPVVDASERGVPALSSVLDALPPVLDDLQPFLRTLDPALRYLGRSRREVGSFLANVTAASQYRVKNIERGGSDVNLVRIATLLSPEGLAFPDRPAGQTRRNPYVKPGGIGLLASGLESFTTESCGNDDPGPPASSSPEGIEGLIQAYAFRTGGRDAARPGCRAQVPPDGEAAFSRLTADPPVTLERAGRRR